MYQVKIIATDELPEDDESYGYRDCWLLRAYHNDNLLFEEMDSGEPEDNSFIRDYSWISKALLQAYKLGKEDAEKKQKPNILDKIKWILTHEDWYPSFKEGHLDNPLKGDALRVHLSNFPQWFVCVWGADDCGMEIWLGEDQVKAYYIYYRIKDFTTREDLKRLGLKDA